MFKKYIIVGFFGILLSFSTSSFGSDAQEENPSFKNTLILKSTDPFFDFLPEELIVRILSYLDPKAGVQSKQVCSSWKSLIEDPAFGPLFIFSMTNAQLKTYILNKPTEELVLIKSPFSLNDFQRFKGYYNQYISKLSDDLISQTPSLFKEAGVVLNKLRFYKAQTSEEQEIYKKKLDELVEKRKQFLQMRRQEILKKERIHVMTNEEQEGAQDILIIQAKLKDFLEMLTPGNPYFMSFLFKQIIEDSLVLDLDFDEKRRLLIKTIGFNYSLENSHDLEKAVHQLRPLKPKEVEDIFHSRVPHLLPALAEEILKDLWEKKESFSAEEKVQLFKAYFNLSLCEHPYIAASSFNRVESLFEEVNIVERDLFSEVISLLYNLARDKFLEEDNNRKARWVLKQLDGIQDIPENNYHIHERFSLGVSYLQVLKQKNLFDLEEPKRQTYLEKAKGFLTPNPHEIQQESFFLLHETQQIRKLGHPELAKPLILNFPLNQAREIDKVLLATEWFKHGESENAASLLKEIKIKELFGHFGKKYLKALYRAEGFEAFQKKLYEFPDSKQFNSDLAVEIFRALKKLNLEEELHKFLLHSKIKEIFESKKLLLGERLEYLVRLYELEDKQLAKSYFYDHLLENIQEIYLPQNQECIKKMKEEGIKVDEVFKGEISFEEVMEKISELEKKHQKAKKKQ